MAIERYKAEHPEADELIVLVDDYLSACDTFYNEVLKTPGSYPSYPAYGSYTTYHTGTVSVSTNTTYPEQEKDNAL